MTTCVNITRIISENTVNTDDNDCQGSNEAAHWYNSQWAVEYINTYLKKEKKKSRVGHDYCKSWIVQYLLENKTVLF